MQVSIRLSIRCFCPACYYYICNGPTLYDCPSKINKKTSETIVETPYML